MEYNQLIQTVISILSSIITGGFVLVFVEIGNRRNREIDSYETRLQPFFHKLSAYFRYLSWCNGYIIYPKALNKKEECFKQLVNKLERYGSRLIMSGGDYNFESFTPKEISDIADDINNVWYWYDKMIPCNMIWDNRVFDQEYIDKEIAIINPKYLQKDCNVALLAKISGDFYVDTYQPIRDEIYKHELYIKLFNRQTIFVSVAVIIVLFMLGLMLFINVPIRILQFSTIVIIILLILSLFLLGVNNDFQINMHYELQDSLNKIYHKICRH